MEKEIIYIKYDGIAMAGHDMGFYLEKIAKRFSGYPWGAGFKTDNFRCSDRYFYCDMISEYYVPDDGGTFQQTASYIQGMISGYLLAEGVEII